MTRIALTAALLLAFVRPIIAANKSPDYILASVRIQSGNNSGENGGCSGTIIAIGPKFGIGISAAHCAVLNQGFKFWNPDGTSGYAKWIKLDKERDLALFATFAKDVLAAAPVAYRRDTSAPMVGVGYPSGRGPVYKSGFKMQARVNRMGSSLPAGGVSFRYDTRTGYFGRGDSGGGLFCNGKLHHVMSHGMPGTSYIETCEHCHVVDFIVGSYDLFISWIGLERMQDPNCPDCSPWYGGGTRPWQPQPNVPINPRPDLGVPQQPIIPPIIPPFIRPVVPQEPPRPDPETGLLRAEVARLTLKVEIMERELLSRPDAPAGLQGPPGRIDVIIQDRRNGNSTEIERYTGLTNGSTVYVDVVEDLIRYQRSPESR